MRKLMRSPLDERRGITAVPLAPFFLFAKIAIAMQRAPAADTQEPAGTKTGPSGAHRRSVPPRSPKNMRNIPTVKRVSPVDLVTQRVHIY
jgi:hypothetical protein